MTTAQVLADLTVCTFFAIRSCMAFSMHCIPHRAADSLNFPSWMRVVELVFSVAYVFHLLCRLWEESGRWVNTVGDAKSMGVGEERLVGRWVGRRWRKGELRWARR